MKNTTKAKLETIGSYVLASLVVFGLLVAYLIEVGG